MSQNSASHAWVALASVLDPGVGDPPAPPTPAELLDEPTRLLALATGENLPLELALRVDDVRRRRAALS